MRLLLPLLALLLSGCAAFRSPDVPMPTQVLLRPASSPEVLLVLLPGRWNRVEAFAREGFGEIVASREAAIEVVAADAHLGYYRERSVIERLREDVVAPARARGIERIWLVGTSLGGVGALFYARDHPEDLAGVVAIAPFLGDDELIEEIRSQGGPASWSPPPDRQEFADDLWLFLGEHAAPEQSPLRIVLAYGTDDGLAPGHELLAELLPPSRVFDRPGGHDWPTWTALFRSVVTSGLFDPDPSPDDDPDR